ncbi:MAG: transglutaminase domain-containing protein [Bacilli bacterium]|nr:transglutaminase domain-containing protein [Bacilli bacterium]
MNNKYLTNNGQSKINDEIKEFCKCIPDINNINDLVELDKIFYNTFTRDTSTIKFERTVIDIFNSKTFSGCSDIGFMICSILREKNIPTIYVETAHIDWLKSIDLDLEDKEIMRGHIFLEIYVNNKWYLYDPTYHIVYDNYDNTNNNYPRGYYVFAKGENAHFLGVHTIADEKELALKLLKDYDYNSYIDPKYEEININSRQIK